MVPPCSSVYKKHYSYLTLKIALRIGPVPINHSRFSHNLWNARGQYRAGNP